MVPKLAQGNALEVSEPRINILLGSPALTLLITLPEPLSQHFDTAVVLGGMMNASPHKTIEIGACRCVL